MDSLPAPLRRISLSHNSADSQASALRLILTLLPDWEHGTGKIEFIRFKDGITNTLLKVVKRQPDRTEEQIDADAVLLRAYGMGTEVLIDREKESANHSLLSSHHLAPPLLARFQNGLLYRYIQGRPCTSQDLTREPIWRAVARRLGEWHAVLPIESSQGSLVTNTEQDTIRKPGTRRNTQRSEAEINRITPDKLTPNVWTVMQKWIFALPESNHTEATRKANLERELEQIVKELADRPGLGKDGLVFAHCDLLSGNVIIHPNKSKLKNPGNETVSFIDYEYAIPSPAAFDIANHFAEWGGFECDYHVLPTQQTRRAFLREYLRSYNHHMYVMDSTNTNTNGHFSKEVEEEQVEKLFKEVDLFRGIPGFYWGIWALIQATISQIDFDYAAYAEVRLGEYWAWRGVFDGTTVSEKEQMELREKRWATETDGQPSNAL